MEQKKVLNDKVAEEKNKPDKKSKGKNGKNSKKSDSKSESANTHSANNFLDDRIVVRKRVFWAPIYKMLMIFLYLHLYH